MSICEDEERKRLGDRLRRIRPIVDLREISPALHAATAAPSEITVVPVEWDTEPHYKHSEIHPETGKTTYFIAIGNRVLLRTNTQDLHELAGRLGLLAADLERDEEEMRKRGAGLNLQKKGA